MTMASKIPSTMRALALAKFCKPAEYNIATLPVPAITKPDEILVKVAAASLNPIDVKMATGLAKMMEPGTGFPYKIGYDLAGTVVAIGTAVTTFKVGDEIYGRAGNPYRGTIAEYALTTASASALKPKTLTFSQAAAIPLAAQTVLQCLDRGDRELAGGLKGKTVYIPAGLSGTGSFGVQIAKNIFGAKVITTLSTRKISKAKELLGEGIPDQIVDYTKEDVGKVVHKGSVDFMFDSVKATLASVPLMKKDGVIVSVSEMPSGSLMKNNFPNVAGWMVVFLNVVDWCFRTWTSFKGVRYSYLFVKSNTKDLERLATWADEGKVNPVVGRQVKLSDLKRLREGAQEVLDGKGGIGKFVIDID